VWQTLGIAFSGSLYVSYRRLLLTCLAALFCASPAWAQFEEIVVTGSRINSDGYSRIPAIVLERRADFLVQRIRLTNDTRAEDGRIKEIDKTIQDMLADAVKRPGIALGYGDDFLIPLTSNNHEVPLEKGSKRPDTSATELYVKMALSEKDNVPKAVAELTAFIKKARLSGRTEIEPEGDVGLSLVTPEKYRYDIIGKITEDAKRLQATVGSQCKIEIHGLSNRVSWQRSDVSQLTLYIPYEVQLTGCQ
jgi:hypothetical protein